MDNHTIFIIILIFGIIAEGFYYKKRELKRKEEAINIAVLATLILSLFLCYLLKEQVSSTTNLVKTIGFFFLIHGLFIRFWTYQIIMAQSHHHSILPLPERPLYSHGPYRYHRHPFHTSIFIITLGCGLFISNHWLAFPLVFLLLGSSLHTVMKQEELFLEKKYGEIYTYWCKRRFRFLPFFY
ncbi:methyltransferase family protein [Salipaludibacillus daqingensis]|uniref:methyltransferase family protein n=1 Tax=Salipaludibacillus daqingensis TaxID=3041001 RepID=UPI00247504AB|nr:isoprenylcysteine carboxylmethyltransferase family protein [Salipaludibacillus daqingensis]